MKGDVNRTGFATRAIHAGQAPDPTTGSVTVPIYQTSTYAQEGLGKNKGYEYARTKNPTRTAMSPVSANVSSRESCSVPSNHSCPGGVANQAIAANGY